MVDRNRFIKGNNMSWQYRIIKSIEDNGLYVGESYSMREVFSDKPNCKITDKGINFSMTPRYPLGDTLDELKSDMEMMMRAFDLPVLDESEFDEMMRSREEAPTE